MDEGLRGPEGARPGGGPGGPNEEDGPIGPFPSWRWVYGTVLVYGAAVILGLWILTRAMDPGAGP